MNQQTAQDAKSRRKFQRHPVRWKVAMVFNSAQGKPVLHTETLDLSAGGAAVHSEYEDLTGSEVTLLLAQPAKPDGEAPKLLKVRARVVSSVHAPAVSGYRHGLSFVMSKDVDLGAFAKLVAFAAASASAPVSVQVTREAPAAAAAEQAPPEESEYPAAPGGLLAQLKAAAAAKLAEEKKNANPEERNDRVGAALERAYRHLKAFAQPLQAEKPAYAKAYSIIGMPGFDGLKWAECKADFHALEVSATKKRFDKVTLFYRLAAGKDLRVSREAPADTKLNQLLQDSGIAFSSQPERNERGAVVKTTFVVPCEVKANLQLLANFDTGKLLLKMRNVEHFGIDEHVISPDSVTDESLKELTNVILGEARRVGPLLLKDA